MFKALPWIFMSAACVAQTSSVTFSFSGTGTGTSLGAFTFTGASSLSGFGSAVASGQGFVSPNVTSGQSSGPAVGTIALVFSNGDFLVGTFNVPAGVLIPFIGGSTTGTGTITIIGGIGRFLGASGSIAISGSGTAGGTNSAAVQLSGTGTLTLLPPAGTAITRTISHLGDGNQFRSTVLLTNSDTGVGAYKLQIYDETGKTPTSGFQLSSGSLSGTIPAGQSVTIQTTGAGSTTVQGWGELTAPPTVGATVIYSQPGGSLLQEGTTTAGAAGSTHFFVPFDNTNNAVTAMALANAGTAAANISVTLRYANGTSETAVLTPLAGRAHTSFAFLTQFPHTANQGGVAEFSSDQAVSTVVFRFNSTGAFTALETISK